jgi:hypothetical protein
MGEYNADGGFPTKTRRINVSIPWSIANLEKQGDSALEFNLADDQTVWMIRNQERPFNQKPDVRTSNVDDVYIEELTLLKSTNWNPFQLSFNVSNKNSSNICGNVYPLSRGYPGRSLGTIDVGQQNTPWTMHKSNLKGNVDYLSPLAAIERNPDVIRRMLSPAKHPNNPEIDMYYVPAKCPIGLLLQDENNRAAIGINLANPAESWRVHQGAAAIMVEKSGVELLLNELSKQKTTELPIENLASDLVFVLQPSCGFAASSITSDPVVQQALQADPSLKNKIFRLECTVEAKYTPMALIKEERKRRFNEAYVNSTFGH